MNKYIVVFLAFLMVLSFKAEAGNPDRQGQAGAYELLLNPWARSSGLKGINVGSINGIEALRINPAGLSYMNKTQVVLARTIHLQGTDINFSAGGLAQRVGENGTVALSIMAVDFGEIEVTTTDNPEGIGATYKPLFFNMGIGYAHKFSDRITTGLTFRVISEQGQNVSAFGAALDAGIQYRLKNLNIGISLRNIGIAMKFNNGDGHKNIGSSPDNFSGSGNIDGFTTAVVPNKFELPTMLNIGFGYDVKFAEDQHRISFMANYASHSFSKDQYGIGMEYSLKEMFMLRVAYQYEDGQLDADTRTSAFTGIAAGLSVEIPVKKESDTKIGLDYSYQTTSPFNGSHSIGLRFDL